MKLRHPTALREALNEADRSIGWLGRRVGRSRQFLHRLASGQVDGCSAEVACSIEGALGLEEGTLFVPVLPLTTGKNSASRAEAAVA
jgi:hypothetical protein